jgi:pyridoxamine 5'-phosphate oxidase
VSPTGAASLAPDPLEQFRDWFAEAVAAGVREPQAMALATCGDAGAPAVRMVLLKGFDARGFRFATSYSSRKGCELEANPAASLLFYWPALQRQVRIEGRVERTSDDESDAIFGERPRPAQLGAWASPQSQEIADRALLERRMSEAAERFPGAVPRPPGWGGYRLIAAALEFWIGRESRLHDRFRYDALRGGGWRRYRLAP